MAREISWEQGKSLGDTFSLRFGSKCYSPEKRSRDQCGEKDLMRLV